MKISQSATLIISDHAMQRAAERWNIDENKVHARIMEVFRIGIPYGAQIGDGVMFVLDDDVIAVRKRVGGVVCATALTKEMADAESDRIHQRTRGLR